MNKLRLTLVMSLYLRWFTGGVPPSSTSFLVSAFSPVLSRVSVCSRVSFPSYLARLYEWKKKEEVRNSFYKTSVLVFPVFCFPCCVCTHETINEFPVLFHIKGGWAGQCSHRLEVFDPPTHPTSRREGVSPCRAIERCFADSPFSRKKGKSDFAVSCDSCEIS